MTPNTEIETPEVEESLEDTLRSAFAAANEAEAPAEAEPQAEAASEEAEAPSGRERDEHGRFKPKAGEEAPAEAGTAVAAPAADQAGDAAAALPDPYGLAPQYASKVVKDKWQTLDPELKKEYYDREAVFHRELTKYDADRNFGKQIKGVVAPFEGLIKSLGAEPLQAIDYLLKGDAALRQGTPAQKHAMFMKLAQDYGVNLGNPGDAPPQQQAVDPQIETLQQRIDRLEREQNDARNRARETDEAEIAQSIEAFAADPAHVYFDRVRPLMGTLMANGHAGSMQEAYDQAVLAHPDTRALHLAANAETEDRKRTAAAAEQAAKARRASPSVTGAPGSAVQTSALNGSSNSVEDDVRAALMLHAGRA